MPYINELISMVNENIRQQALTDKRFSGAKLEGVACQVAREGAGSAIELFPAVVEMGKVERYIGVDDTYPLIIYHRVLGNTYSDDARHSQYGDGFQTQQCNTDMVMVVFGKRRALRITAEQLEALIVSGFPDQFVNGATDGLQLFSARVSLQASTMDSLSVFNSEYRNVKYFLGPEDILFSMKYKIESRYRKHCFKICEPDV